MEDSGGQWRTMQLCTDKGTVVCKNVCMLLGALPLVFFCMYSSRPEKCKQMQSMHEADSIN